MLTLMSLLMPARRSIRQAETSMDVTTTVQRYITQWESRGPNEVAPPKNLWNLQEERQGEADNPGPSSDANEEDEILIIESANITSASTNMQQLLSRTAIITCFQEHCLNPAQLISPKGAAKNHVKHVMAGQLEPERGRASAGVGIITNAGINMHPVPDPLQYYSDAYLKGRCAIYGMDCGMYTL